jgi:hypothetical protein
MENLTSDAEVTLAGRLGKLEGLLVGLQQSITAQSQQTAQFLVRVERLEQRQLELERSVATVDDFRLLSGKVDSLLTSDATAKGRQSVSQFAIPALAQWATVVIALLALVGVGMNRQAIQQERPAQERGTLR